VTDSEKASNWLNCWKHVSKRNLAWHMTACLEADGEKTLNEALKAMNIRSAVDLVRAHSD
jgi:hypothetical protein